MTPSWNSLCEILRSNRLEKLIVKDFVKPIGFIQLIGDKLVVAGQKKVLLPTKSTNKFISWDYLDFSVRVTYMDNEKVAYVIENSHDGQINCLCVSSDCKYLITGGNDSLLCVREMKKIQGSNYFVLLKTLSGNFTSIQCVTVSRSFSIIVSVAQDNTVIIWDLNRLAFVQLVELSKEVGRYQVSSVTINDLNGNIVLIAGPYIQICNVNGQLVTIRKTLWITSFTISCSVSCDWLVEYITGHEDGSIRVIILFYFLVLAKF